MADMLEYKCPCCGGAINFDSKLQKMKCPYCDTEFDMETLKSYDEDLKKNVQDNMNWDNSNEQTFTDEETEGMSVYVCNSCGGEIVADENTGATSCPYCGNPVVLKGRFSGDLKPDYVIPFRLSREDAIKALSNHVNKKLVPKIFKDKNHIDQIRGMYVPFWLFDADTEAHIHYKGTKVRHWSDSRYDYTETKYYLVGRGGNVGFTNVPVDGSSQMPDDLMESIEPFNFDEAVDFQTAYLAGYLADKYDVTKENSINRANQRIKNTTEQLFRQTASEYSSLTTQNSSVQFQNGTSKYALYPVWILNTSWNGQNFLFAMNGQTGKMVGDLPVDWGAFWRYFAIIAGSIAAVIIIIGLLYNFL
ncbi:hypothetical protein ACTQ2N_09990 [Ruminococcus sp. LCP21S3_E8]